MRGRHAATTPELRSEPNPTNAAWRSYAFVAEDSNSFTRPILVNLR